MESSPPPVDGGHYHHRVGGRGHSLPCLPCPLDHVLPGEGPCSRVKSQAHNTGSKLMVPSAVSSASRGHGAEGIGFGLGTQPPAHSASVPRDGKIWLIILTDRVTDHRRGQPNSIPGTWPTLWWSCPSPTFPSGPFGASPAHTHSTATFHHGCHGLTQKCPLEATRWAGSNITVFCFFFLNFSYVYVYV